jgi:hypothetical protein
VATYPTLPSAANYQQNVASAPVSSAANEWVQKARPSAQRAPVSSAANEWVQTVRTPAAAAPIADTVSAWARAARPSTEATAKENTEAETTVSDGQRYGHDPNYHWLVGTLDYSRIQDAWVLRYGSYEAEDRYGGCVTLVAPGRGVALKQGQTVRVEGDLIDPTSQQMRPAFQVRNIRVEGS